MTQPKLEFARTALQRIALVALAAGLTSCAVAQTMPATAPVAASTGVAPTQTPPMNGIAHIAIRVQSIADSLAFYNKLGYQQAFAWTRGYQAGDFNIFVTDIGAPGILDLRRVRTVQQ